MPSDAKTLFREGQLDAALEAQVAVVRDNPNDPEARALLSDLQCFTGALDKADRQLDLLSTQHTKLAVAVAQSRQLIRAAMARQEVFEKGRAPDLATEPDAFITSALQALLAWREGRAAEAKAILDEAESKREKVPGTRDGKAFDDFRDADDLCAGFVEILSTTGKYFWVPTHRVDFIEFEKTQRPRDLLWRQATVEVRGGPEGVVFIPATYPMTPSGPEATALRLGRATNWSTDADGPVRGIGQRMFLAGEEGVGMDEITAVRFGSGS